MRGARFVFFKNLRRDAKSFPHAATRYHLTEAVDDLHMRATSMQDIKAKKAAEFGPFGAIRRDARAASSQDPSPWTSQTLYTSAAQVLSLGFNNLIFVGTQPKACAA